MSRKFPRKNRMLTVAIKGRLDEMPPEHGGVMEINGKRYRVQRVMRHTARNTPVGWKEYTLNPTEREDGGESDD